MRLSRSVTLMLILLFWTSSCMRVKQPVTTPSPQILREVLPPTLGVTDSMLIFTADGQFVTIKQDGSERRILASSDRLKSFPSVSKDGKYIAYVSAEEGNDEIYITPWFAMEDLARATNITRTPEYIDSAPCWSPDGTQIAYSSFYLDTWGIFTAEILIHDEYSEPILLSKRRLTSNNRFDGHPAWSPDSNWIAYTSDRGFRWQIYLSHTSGTLTLPLTGTTNLKSTAYPAWSPDGSHVAFASTFDGSWDIYSMRTDGSDLLQLTSNPAQDWHPAWSPNGEWIAFVSDRSGGSDIYLFRSDGLELVQLSDNEAVEDFPEWIIP